MPCRDNHSQEEWFELEEKEQKEQLDKVTQFLCYMCGEYGQNNVLLGRACQKAPLL